MDPVLKTAWDELQPKLLFPSDKTHPYYITAPRWTNSSAGIRALHLLCHALNRSGLKAFMLHHPFDEHPRTWTNDELLTPMLYEKQAKEHFEQGLTPIVLYPETISGNPLQASLVARWVMNFPGLLGGDFVYDPQEICFGYSRELAAAAGVPEQVLHMPTIDTRIFYPADDHEKRSGGCFCASKYKLVHNGILDPITDGCFEITRQMADSLTPKELAEFLRRSEIFYAYENTALATEAVLCGCPAVFIPNPYLTEMIGREELGAEGFAWGTDPAAIERARAGVTQGAINYFKTYDLFWDQLAVFIKLTQQRARTAPCPEMIALPSWPPTGMGKQIYRLKKELRRFARRVKRRLGLGQL